MEQLAQQTKNAQQALFLLQTRAIVVLELAATKLAANKAEPLVLTHKTVVVGYQHQTKTIAAQKLVQQAL
jgi:hypothetical protein